MRWVRPSIGSWRTKTCVSPWEGSPPSCPSTIWTRPSGTPRPWGPTSCVWPRICYCACGRVSPPTGCSITGRASGIPARRSPAGRWAVSGAPTASPCGGIPPCWRGWTRATATRRRTRRIFCACCVAGRVWTRRSCSRPTRMRSTTCGKSRVCRRVWTLIGRMWGTGWSGCVWPGCCPRG